MALVIALALMTGLQRELRDRIARLDGARLRLQDRRVSPTIDAEVARLRAGARRRRRGAGASSARRWSADGDRQAFISIKGIDPALEPTSPTSARRCSSGALRATSTGDGDDDRPGILLGDELAGQLGACVGDTVTLLTPQRHAVADGRDAAAAARCRSSASSSSACSSSTQAYGFVSLDDRRPAAGKDRARPHPAAGRATSTTRRRSPTPDPSSSAPSYLAQDWADINRSLFSALWLEKMAISIAIGLIVMVARAQHHRVARPARDGEEPRHRHPQDDGRVGAAASAGSSCCRGWSSAWSARRSAARSGSRCATVLDRYRLIHIPIDVYQISHLPFVVVPLDFVDGRRWRRSSSASWPRSTRRGRPPGSIRPRRCGIE